MQTPLSEIIDRYSILMLKNERLVDEDLKEELETYKKEIDFSKMGDFVKRLYEVNGTIWDLESDIRRGKEKELGLEEVGRRAIKLRDLNKIRISIKNEIVKFVGQGFIEVKINHASQI